MPLKKIYLELTNACNLNCTICYRRSWNEPAAEIDARLFSTIKKQIDDISSLSSFVIGGIGEPSCSPILGEVIARLLKYNVILTTNAVTLDERLLENIVSSVKRVMVSIDGVGETFARIRGTGLESVISNIKRINDLKKKNNSSHPEVGIQFVLSKDNVDDIFGVIDIASDLKADIMIVSNLLPQTRENAQKILYKKYGNDEIRKLFSRISNYAFRKGLKLILPNTELKTERYCSFIEEDATFITAAGEVVPCYRFAHSCLEYVFGREKHAAAHSFGNVKDKPLIEIWNSNDYKNYRQTVRNNRYPSCPDCDLVDGCDLVNNTSSDCYANAPSCADCLWARNIVICP
jgi:tungsten cofactor oxidoreducase radical SAM maturase